MNLRLKLLLIFVVSALSAFTFFGFVAYDTAKATNIKNEAALLASVVTRIAAEVGHHLEKGTSWSPVLTPENDALTNNPIYLLVTDGRGSVISAPESLEYQQAILEFRQLVPVSAADRSGSFGAEDASYVWAQADIAQSGYRAILLSRSNTSKANSFFREMGVTLIVTCFILLWCASWAAMYIAGLFEKLDEQKNILCHRALHDELTQLPNRAFLNMRIQQVIELSEREQTGAALCFIDLNRFKEVNDTMGHGAGDELLLEVGRRLQADLRKSDAVARIGGDEFALILRNVDAASAKSVVEKLLLAVEAPIELRSRNVNIGGSAGIALIPCDGRSAEVLMQKADVAMYAAKRSGARVVLYSKDCEAFHKDKPAAIRDLRGALQQ